ncbi:hypothetical protein SCARD494_05943 [Seiridium cardinale]
MARLFALFVMVFAMLHAAMAFPHKPVTSATPLLKLNTTEPAVLYYNTTVARGYNETATPVKRAMRNFPIALRAPGRDV